MLVSGIGSASWVPSLSQNILELTKELGSLKLGSVKELHSLVGSLMKEYSRSDIVRLTQATESHLTHWSKIGLLQADALETHGTGHHRRYSFRALIEAEVAARLNFFGIPVAHIQILIEVFRFVSSHGVRKGSTPEFKRWRAKRTADPTLPTLLEQWQTFVNPVTRSRVGFAGLMVNQAGWVFAVDEVDEPWTSERTAGAVTVVINLKHIVEELEEKTGDLWISTADDPSVKKQRRGATKPRRQRKA